MSDEEEGAATMPLTFKHHGETLTVAIRQYENGTPAIVAVDETGLPFATLSVNVPGQSELLPPGAFFLKDYSENADVAESFMAQVPLTPTARVINLGFVSVQAFGLGVDGAGA
jgi:hypothetical protein